MLFFIAIAVITGISCLTLCAVMLKGSLATPEQIALQDLEQMRALSRHAAREDGGRDDRSTRWPGQQHPTSH